MCYWNWGTKWCGFYVPNHDHTRRKPGASDGPLFNIYSIVYFVHSQLGRTIFIFFVCVVMGVRRLCGSHIWMLEMDLNIKNKIIKENIFYLIHKKHKKLLSLYI
jgi:hypothetical protein